MPVLPPLLNDVADENIEANVVALETFQLPIFWLNEVALTNIEFIAQTATPEVSTRNGIG